jgi:cytochrome c556
VLPIKIKCATATFYASRSADIFRSRQKPLESARRNHMLRIAATATALAIGATVVLAQNAEVIKQRREAMRAIAKAGTPPFKMSKGELPFDLATVQAGLKAYQEQGAKLKGLFPEDSKTGKTDASSKIWQARSEFESAVDTFVGTAKSAAAAIKDEATFKDEYPKVVRSCGGCHKETDGFSPRLGDSFKRMQEPLQ